MNGTETVLYLLQFMDVPCHFSPVQQNVVYSSRIYISIPLKFLTPLTLRVDFGR